MAKITLAVTGSISAYKSADLTSQLVKQGHTVTVLMTQAAREFITPLTLQVLSKRPVYTDLMQEDDPAVIRHIEVAKQTDLFLLAPATAQTIAKLAHGRAEDMVSAVALALPSHCKKLIAPAMNTAMYLHPATQTNLRLLADYGFEEILPRESLLACGDVGLGALATIDTILEKVSHTIS